MVRFASCVKYHNIIWNTHKFLRLKRANLLPRFRKNSIKRFLRKSAQMPSKISSLLSSKKRFKMSSDFKFIFYHRQAIKRHYGFSNSSQFMNIINALGSYNRSVSEQMVKVFESRLDILVYRLGLCSSTPATKPLPWYSTWQNIASCTQRWRCCSI